MAFDLTPIIQWKAKVDQAILPYDGEISALDALAIIYMESRGHPDVVNKSFPAVGLMGVVAREAGEDFKDRPTIEELKDPDTNIFWGLKILAYFLHRGEGSFWKALYRYSGGNTWSSYVGFIQGYWVPFGIIRGDLEEWGDGRL
jgi:soluble lytic murein transglycosylase-like protein